MGEYLLLGPGGGVFFRGMSEVRISAKRGIVEVTVTPILSSLTSRCYFSFGSYPLLVTTRDNY